MFQTTKQRNAAAAKARSQFIKGSGVFTCRCCNRATRNTGGDNQDVRLCAECYDLSSYENKAMGDGLDAADIHHCCVLFAQLCKLQPTATPALFSELKFLAD